jgi:hypothetical protein
MRERNLCGGCYAEIGPYDDQYCSKCKKSCCPRCSEPSSETKERGRPLILCNSCRKTPPIAAHEKENS